ncbi:MAG: acyltransferase [Methanobrevibacter sp.]|uniref:acyltransferase n=1 Tax=Methanobrevibacter sp. TaxID=66852 RepID=UPI0025F33477|nr:acyltransferase [Methanobrevibacter sp.]MBQ6139458.1 acyltransferase [Methanobrevibacter sp.]
MAIKNSLFAKQNTDNPPSNDLKENNSDINNAKNKKKKSKRIFYFDALRALAIIAVISFHVSKRMSGIIFSTHAGGFSLQWLFGDFFFAGMIIGVDLFLMLSGALSLGREWSIRSFLGKRIPRIAAPFLFWGLLLMTVILLLQYHFPDLLHVVDAFDFSSITTYMSNAFLGNAFGFGPYWFFWMILGTYLIMPIFNKWLLHADLKEAEYFLAIWLITCIFDNTLNYPFPIKISYFTSPIGFVVLGYYLRHTKRKIFNNKIVPVVLIIIGLFCLLYGSYVLSDTSLFKFDRYSIFNAIEVAGVFLLFKNYSDINFGALSKPDNIIRNAISSIAKYSYGFYLIHQAIMDIFIRILVYTNMYTGYVSLFLKLFVVTLGVSWILMATLNRIPYINQIIGAK